MNEKLPYTILHPMIIYVQLSLIDMKGWERLVDAVAKEGHRLWLHSLRCRIVKQCNADQETKANTHKTLTQMAPRVSQASIRVRKYEKIFMQIK